MQSSAQVTDLARRYIDGIRRIYVGEPVFPGPSVVPLSCIK